MLMQALVDAIGERADLELAGGARTGREALEGIGAVAPDVAVLDIRLPALDGQQVLQRATDAGTRTRFLFLTAHMDSVLVYAALGAGASGYLSQTLDRDAICDAIGSVAAGRIVLCPEAQSKLAGAIREREAHERPALTARERAVLGLCAD